jgi:hypothetical protein
MSGLSRSACAFAVLLCACQGDPLESADDVAGWANTASALAVYTHGYEPLAFADGEISFDDPTCPATTDDGMTVTIAGDGCESSEGEFWFGSATVVRTPGRWILTLDTYGKGQDAAGSSRTTGIFDVIELDVDRYSFDVDLYQNGGIDTDIVYSGTVEGTYDGPTVWNGEGSVRREGVTIDSGTVEAVTVDQLRDNDICPGEGVSGTTTLVSDEHTVVITYDGATDCDDDSAARWSLDGADQGLVTGVVCAIGAPSGRRGEGGAGTLLIPLALLGLLGLRSRR